MFKLLLLAGLGGFCGTATRFLINRAFTSWGNFYFPLATLTINMTGCFLIGLLFGLLQRGGHFDPKLNALLITGFCGGFTTFSTFSFESLNLGLDSHTLLSFLYIGISVCAGLCLTWIGLNISR